MYLSNAYPDYNSAWIKDEWFFCKPYLMNICDDQGKKIGDVYGRILDAQAVYYDIEENGGDEFFYEADGHSQLLCYFAEFVLRKIPKETLKNTHNILFLNRLSLDEDHLSDYDEIKALDLLFNHAETVIYSVGNTELDDDFPKREPEYWDNYERLLKFDGWKLKKWDRVEVYMKSDPDRWTMDALKDILFNTPLHTVNIIPSELCFWNWLFRDAKEMMEGFVIGAYELDKEFYSAIITMLFYFQYADKMLQEFDAYDKSSKEKKVGELSISPFFLSLVLEHLPEMINMRKDGSFATVAFCDLDVKDRMDRILKKYCKLFRRIRKDSLYVPVYEPLLSHIYTGQDELTVRRMYKAVLQSRDEYTNLDKE